MIGMLRLLCIALAALLMTAGAVRAAPRALVVGIDYSGAPMVRPLPNAGRDAALVARALGPYVASIDRLDNPAPDALEAGVRAYLGRLGPEDVAIIYLAGHGVQVEGRNYLLAADGLTAAPIDALIAAVNARARGALFLIDACRDDPLSRPAGEPAPMAGAMIQTMSANGAADGLTAVPLEAVAGARGLAQAANVRGAATLLLFATEPGNVARDGAAGGNGPFAAAIAREIVRRASFDDVSRRIARRVASATRGAQAPWRQGDLGFDFYLAGQPRFPVP